MQFRIDDVGPEACGPGIDKARGVFKSRRDYSLDETLAAGLTEREVLWLAAHRAEADDDAMVRFRGWVRRCGGRLASRAGMGECFRALHRATITAIADRVAGGVLRPAAKAAVRAENFQRLLVAFRD